MANYLDSNGVSKLWNKCKDTFATKGTWQENISLAMADLEEMLNKVYKIDGIITFIASAGGNTSYRYVRNGIFKITGVSRTGSGSSSGALSATINLSYFAQSSASGSSNTSFSWTTATVTASGSGYGYGSPSAKFTGVLTQLD